MFEFLFKHPLAVQNTVLAPGEAMAFQVLEILDPTITFLERGDESA